MFPKKVGSFVWNRAHTLAVKIRVVFDFWKGSFFLPVSFDRKKHEHFLLKKGPTGCIKASNKKILDAYLLMNMDILEHPPIFLYCSCHDVFFRIWEEKAE